MLMTAAEIQQLAARAPLAPGYRFVLLERAEISALVANVAAWFPDISVGGASCYLREDFYHQDVFFPDTAERRHLVLLLKRADEVAGMFSIELDPHTLSLYAGLGVSAPEHRGANLAQAGMMFCEVVGRRIGAGFVYGLATLKNPYAQRAFERAGWKLIGIAPGYDREMVAPGVVKRIYEAMYAKVLAADTAILHPQRQNLTPRTLAFFDWVFEGSGPGCESVDPDLTPTQTDERLPVYASTL
ncbi:MAG TPA: GNAT family N-acetyltransferase [Povalibacter sp.]|nr:GNAT family N-acetyltransferase [Povalibacter sp.]